MREKPCRGIKQQDWSCWRPGSPRSVKLQKLLEEDSEKRLCKKKAPGKFC